MEHSPFAKLAPELRNKIWALCVTPDSPIRIGIKPTDGTQPAITRTCRQIRDETILMFYALNVFRAGWRFSYHEHIYSRKIGQRLCRFTSASPQDLLEIGWPRVASWAKRSPKAGLDHVRSLEFFSVARYSLLRIYFGTLFPLKPCAECLGRLLRSLERCGYYRPICNLLVQVLPDSQDLTEYETVRKHLGDAGIEVEMFQNPKTS